MLPPRNPNAGVASGDAKDDPDYANPSLDMGMFGLPSKGVPRGAALQEPRLALPDTNDALHLKSDSGKKYVLKPRTKVLVRRVQSMLSSKTTYLQGVHVTG